MVSLPLLAALVQALSGAPADALQAPAGTNAIVFLFTSTDCPLSNRYAPEVRRIADAFASKGVVFRIVYPNPADDAKAIREHMTSYSSTQCPPPLVFGAVLLTAPRLCPSSWAAIEGAQQPLSERP